MRSGRRKSDAFTFLATPPIKTRAMEFVESEEYGTEKIIDMWKGGLSKSKDIHHVQMQCKVTRNTRIYDADDNLLSPNCAVCTCAGTLYDVFQSVTNPPVKRKNITDLLKNIKTRTPENPRLKPVPCAFCHSCS